MLLSRLRYGAFRFSQGRRLLRTVPSVGLSTSTIGTTIVVPSEEANVTVRKYPHSFDWVIEVLAQLHECSQLCDAKGFVTTLKRFSQSPSKGLHILNKVVGFLTNDLIEAQTNLTIGELLQCLGDLKLDCESVEKHRRLISLLFKRAVTLNNMSSEAIRSTLDGLAKCGFKWQYIVDVSSIDNFRPGSPLVLSCEESKKQFLEQLYHASLEISHFRTANQIIIGLSKLDLKYSELPIALQTELLSSDSSQLWSHKVLCKDTLRALLSMEFSPHTVDTARRAFVLDMLRVAFKTEFRANPLNVYSLYKFVLAALKMGPGYHECPDDLVKYVEKSVVLVELQPVGVLAVLDGMSYAHWPWLRLPTAFRCRFEAFMVQLLPSLTEKELATILNQCTNLSLVFDDLSEPLQDAIIHALSSRHFSGIDLISILSSLGKLRMSYHMLPGQLLEACLVPFLTVEVDTYSDLDVVTTVEALARLGLEFHSLPSSVRKAVENAVLYQSHRFSAEQVDSIVQGFAQMKVPFKELAPALQKALVSCTLLFDNSMPLIDQLTKMSANFVNLDKLSRRAVIRYLEVHFKEVQQNPRKALESITVLMGCGVRWSYLTHLTQSIILAAVNNMPQLSGEQLCSLVALLADFGVSWEEFNVGLKQKLLLNMSQNNTFNDDNAEKLVQMLASLTKLGVPNSSFFRRRLRPSLQSCAVGLRNVQLVPPLLKAFSHWEMSLQQLEECSGTAMAAIYSAVNDCTDFEVLTDILLHVAVLTYDLPTQWDRAELRSLNAAVDNAVQRLTSPDASITSLNKLAVYREVYGMLCEPLIVVKKSVDVVLPPNTGLEHSGYVLPVQKRLRTYIVNQVAEHLTSISPAYTVRKFGYLLNSCGFAIDGAVHYDGKLIGFLDVDMHQYHYLFVDANASVPTPTEIVKPVVNNSSVQVIFVGSLRADSRGIVASECNNENLSRILKLRDKIHSRYYRDATAPIFRTMPMLTRNTLAFDNADKLSAKIAKIIVKHHENSGRTNEERKQ